MSEKQSPLYTRKNHPHTGDLRVDPLARLERKTQAKPRLPQRRPLGVGMDEMFDESAFVDQSILAQKPDLERKHVNSSYKIEFHPDPKVPYKYVWLKGKFFTGAPGSGVGAFAGELEGRAKIASLGKKLIKVYNGFRSVNGKIIEVKSSKDRQHLGKSGWWEWEEENISRETPKRRRVRKSTA